MRKNLACLIGLFLMIAAIGWAADIKINFQPQGAEVPAGYLPDYGELYASRGTYSYGWLTNHTDVTRDRNLNADQKLDTLIDMHANTKWEIALSNGQYAVTVSIGDAGFASAYTVNIEGINYWNAIALGVNQFANKTVIVTINDGKLTIDNGNAAEKMTRINYVVITSPATIQPTPVITPTSTLNSAPLKINYQPAGVEVPVGYLQDNGNPYGDRNNGYTYGWLTNHTDVARDRNLNTDQRLDTIIHMHTGATWEIALPNGQYSVTVSIGDAGFASNYTVNVEGTDYFNAVALGINQFINNTMLVTVNDGKLTVNNGNSSENATRINYIEIVAALPLTQNPAPTQGGVEIQYRCIGTMVNTNTIAPWFQVKNTGTTPINLSSVSLRYWFTKEGTEALNYACDWAQVGNTNLQGAFTTVSGATNADTFFEIKFTNGAGSLAAGATSGPIQLRIWKSNWTNFNQSNDYSFNPLQTSYGANTKVTGYLNGILNFGVEPFTPTPTPTATPTSGTPGARPGDVWFAESNISACTGTTFLTHVLVNTGSQKLAAYTLDISFNSSVIVPDTSFGISSVSAGADGFVTVVNPNISGKLTISSFDLAGKGPSPSLQLLTIQWLVKGDGYSRIAIKVTTLSDQSTTTISLPYGYGTDVLTCNATMPPTSNPTPTPTPTPTQSPTVIPSITPTANNHVPGDVWFAETNQTVTTGQSFTTDIYVNTGTRMCAGYTFDLRFDSNLIAVDSSIGTNGASAGAEGFVTECNTNLSGAVTVTGIDANGKNPSNNLHLLTIHWKALSKGGITTLTNIVTALVDETGMTIGHPGVNNMTVRVSPPVTPTPSSSPTPTPTTTPTRSPIPGQNIGDVWFGESSIAVKAGDQFITNIYVNSGTQKLAAYTFNISYNSNIIAVDTTIGTSGLEAGKDGFVTITNANTPGNLVASSFDVTGKGPGTNLHVLTIHWKATGQGTTTLINNVTALSDKNAETIGIPKGYSVQISVGPGITTTPTRTPTPIPTSTPTATPSPGERVGDVWFKEKSFTVRPTDKFITNILVNTGTQKLAAYTFEITYNDSVIGVDTTYGTSGVMAGTDGFITVVNANTPGKLVIGSFDVMGKGPSASLQLLNIQWTAKLVGTTSIINNVTTLSDPNPMPIGISQGYNISVSVH